MQDRAPQRQRHHATLVCVKPKNFPVAFRRTSCRRPQGSEHPRQSRVSAVLQRQRKTPRRMSGDVLRKPPDLPRPAKCSRPLTLGALTFYRSPGRPSLDRGYAEMHRQADSAVEDTSSPDQSKASVPSPDPALRVCVYGQKRDHVVQEERTTGSTST